MKTKTMPKKRCHLFGVRPIYKNNRIVNFESCPDCSKNDRIQNEILKHSREWHLQDTTRIAQIESDQDFYEEQNREILTGNKPLGGF